MKPIINNPRPIKTVTGKKPDQSTLYGVRFKIKQDCDGRTPKTRNTDAEAVERHRKLEDIAERRKSAKENREVWDEPC